jgi:hypothetical protein
MSSTPRGLATLLGLASVLALGACSSGSPGSTGASATESGDVRSGWTRAEVPDEGFSIGLPDGWDELSADDLGQSGIFEELQSANPDAAGALAQAQDAIESGQIALFAFDAEPDDTTGQFAANVNVINAGEASGSASDTAQQMADAIRAQVPVNGEVETDTATLPAGEAGVVRYEWTVASGDTSTDVAVIQYAILANGSGYILSCSAASDTLDSYRPIFEQIAESFEAS